MAGAPPGAYNQGGPYAGGPKPAAPHPPPTNMTGYDVEAQQAAAFAAAFAEKRVRGAFVRMKSQPLPPATRPDRLTPQGVVDQSVPEAPWEVHRLLSTSTVCQRSRHGCPVRGLL
jgi:hypothetical protein